jgi:hypothetical protein
VRSQRPTADVKGILDAMINTGLIKKVSGNRFVPIKSVATISEMHPLTVDHVAKTVMRLVETVHRNTQRRLESTRLIERYAHVPDLDPATARSFAAFSRQQGQAYLDSIEDWLESRRANRPSARAAPTKKSVSAGVHIFAYVGRKGHRGNAVRQH